MGACRRTDIPRQRDDETCQPARVFPPGNVIGKFKVPFKLVFTYSQFGAVLDSIN
jgi:hypothetical protein